MLAALWTVSNGRCYAPGCIMPVVLEVRPGISGQRQADGIDGPPAVPALVQHALPPLGVPPRCPRTASFTGIPAISIGDVKIRTTTGQPGNPHTAAAGWGSLNKPRAVVTFRAMLTGKKGQRQGFPASKETGDESSAGERGGRPSRDVIYLIRLSWASYMPNTRPDRRWPQRPRRSAEFTDGS